MTLRTALVIEGSAEGAKKAAQETAGAIVEVKKAAAEASKETAAVTGNLEKASAGAGGVASELKQVAPAARDAGIQIEVLGKAADQVHPKFSSAATAIAGFVGGIVGGAALGAAAGVIEGAVTALGTYASQALSKTDEIDTALKGHIALIKSIRGAYAEAEGGASSYGNNSLARLRFESQQNIGRLQGAYRDALPQGGQFDIGMFETAAGGPFQEPVARFLADIRAGRADVIAFRTEIAAIAAELGKDDPYRGLAETLLEETRKAAEVLEELRRSQDVLKGVEGDSKAAAAALGGAAEKYDALGTAAASAATKIVQSQAAIGGVAPSPARAAATPPLLTPIQPFAAGGIVDRPTLFGFGAGRTGLMAEAGPEAILPLSGGRVRAMTASGGEIGLELARLGDGSLGVVLPQAFALGGSFPSAPGASAAAYGRTDLFGSRTDLFGGLAADVDLLRGSLSGFVTELRRGGGALQALGSIVGRVSERYLSQALGAADRAVFSGNGLSSLGGWFGRLAGLSQSDMAASGLITGLFHGGGDIGRSPSATRLVSPSVFFGAPRSHSGGIVGGEVPVIAKEGEEIGWPGELARKYGGRGHVTNVYVETPDARSFAESRATVSRAAARLSARAARYV